MTDLDPLLTEEEVAKILRVSMRTMRALRGSGQIASIKIADRLIRYSPTDVAAYIATARQQFVSASPRSKSTRTPVTGIIPFSQRRRTKK